MKNRPSFLAVIPARGGSKGIPRKNSKQFLGKPLLAWTVEVARKSGLFDRVLLSTEDANIAEIGRAYGADVPFLRPVELSEDATLTGPVILHAIEWLKHHEAWVPDYVMVLEPTSPARQAFHILESADLLISSGAESVASIAEVPHHYNPSKVLALDKDKTIRGFGGAHIKDMIHRRQDLPPCYAFCGIIFGCETSVLLRKPHTLWGRYIVGYAVDRRYALDIDTPEDWVISEARMRDILGEASPC